MKGDNVQRNMLEIPVILAVVLGTVLAGAGIGFLALNIDWYVILTGVLALILLAIVLLSKPVFRIAALIVTIFLLVLPINTPSASLGGLTILSTTVMKDLFWLMLLMLWIPFLFVKRKRTSSRLTLLLLLYMAWTVVRGLLSPTGLNAGILGIRATAQYVPLALMVMSAVESDTDLRTLLWAVIISSIIPLVISVTRLTDIINVLSVTQLDALGNQFGQYRIIPFGDISSGVNVYAGYIAIILSAVVAMIMMSREESGSIRYALLIGYALILGITLLLTFSRRTWLAFAIVILLYIAIQRLGIRVFLIVMIFGSVFLLLPDTMVSTVASRLGANSYGSVDPGLQIRVKEWQFLWDSVSETPLTLLAGLGFGRAGSVGAILYPDTSINGHNYYILTIYQLGLIGLGMLVTILISGVLKIRNILQNDTTPPIIRQASATALGSFIIIIVSALAGITFENYPLNLLFWLFLGISMSCEHLVEREREMTVTPAVATLNAVPVQTILNTCTLSG